MEFNDLVSFLNLSSFVSGGMLREHCLRSKLSVLIKSISRSLLESCNRNFSHSSCSSRHMSWRILFKFWIPNWRNIGINLLLQQRQKSGEMCQDQSPLLRGHLIFFCPEFVQQLLPHGLKD